MKKYFIILLALHMLVLCPDLFAQEESKLSTKRTKWWLDGGFGHSTLGSVGVAFGINVQLQDVLLTLRASGGQDTFVFGPIDNLNQLEDAAILVGLFSENRKRHASFSAGIARVTGFYEGKDVNRIGFPLQSQLFLKASRVIGFGLNIFANLNGEQSFGGIVLSLNLGRLR